jgi:hypothetical protein
VSFFRTAGVAVKRLKLAIGVGLAPAPIADARKAICRSCHRNNGGRCDICGCPVAAKVKLAGETCPAGRW